MIDHYFLSFYQKQASRLSSTHQQVLPDLHQRGQVETTVENQWAEWKGWAIFNKSHVLQVADDVKYACASRPFHRSPLG